MTCVHCNDTGSLSRDLDGPLDCALCGVADERAAVEKWVWMNTGKVNPIDAWLIYQHGKAAAALNT